MSPAGATAPGRWPDVPARPLVCCLPPAGGSAATFRPWLRAPGRLDRPLDMQAVNLRLLQAQQDMTLLDLAAAVAGQVPADRPYVLAGHSLGGLLAYEAAVELHRRGGRLPAFVLVMGSRPPHHSSADLFAPVVELPDEAFLDTLEAVGAVNSALRTSPLRPLFLPALRADLRIITTYRPDTASRRRDPLPVPVISWCGSSDPLAPPSLLSGWEEYTLFPTPVRIFDGGHFFPFEEARECLAALEALCGDLALLRGTAPVSPVANTLHKSGSAT
ncbi:thioesterase II family protein [Pseudarthrobacter oxydans]|jgi:surfactin synthase thioesterase subunit|uniref:thioesterase II family protein n=1 Tax=Pseudarthrobacter oxydans TaxID=1671 RepID=UPI0029383DDE|nr:alpha/beta fold hydrolase [Actinomycetes bacterium ARC8]